MLSSNHFRNYCLKCLLFLIAIALISGCRSLTSIATTDLSRSYSEKTKPEEFRCSVFNINDSISSAFTIFPYNRLTYSRSAKGEQPFRRFRLTFTLYNSIKDERIVDSASIRIVDSLPNTSLLFTHKQMLRAVSGHNYILQIKVTDQNAGIDYMLLQPFSKDSHSASDWFGFETESQGFLFENQVNSNEPVRLIASDKSLKSVTALCYFRNFPPAPPPFAEELRRPFDYTADSTFILPLENGLSGFFTLPKQGFCFFQPDTSASSGITVYRNYDGYPKVTNPKRMLEPLRYITTAQEFKQMASNPYLKVAVDSFWVAMAGGPDRAVELIQGFYHRIEEANRLFFSFCEGWKTDRGMVYIAFGQPNVVYRSDFQELWVYGEANNFRSMRFVFLKVQNPFTDNDYVLERQAYYKDYWYNSVQKWRR